MKYQANHIFTLLTAIWLTLLPAISPAQQPYQHRYTTGNGLLFGEAGVSLTRNGEAWIHYSSGEYISRFDGVNWTHYHLTSLQLPSAIYYFGEDEHGIWFYRSSPGESWLVCRTPDGQWKRFHKPELHFPYPDPATGSPSWIDKQCYRHRYDAKVDSFVREKTPVYVPAGTNEELAAVGNLCNGDVYLKMKPVGSELPVIHFGAGFEKTFQLPNGLLDANFEVGESLVGALMHDDEICWYTGETCKPILPKLPSGRIGKPASWIQIKHVNAPSQTYSPGLIVQSPDKKNWYLYELDSLGSARRLLGPLAGDFPRGYIWQDKLQNWWYSLSNGIVRLDENLLIFDETHPNMVSGLHAIGEDAQGNIWMGGYNGIGGFSVFDGRELHRRIFTGLAMQVLPGTVRSSSGTSYFFTEYESYLFALRDGRLEGIRVPGIDYLLGYYLCQLKNGQLGLGLASKGLGIATETNGLISSVKLVDKSKGLLLDNVLTITEDRGGRLWLGRISQGIALYDPARDTAGIWRRAPHFPGRQGAYRSFLDDEGTLWLGTNRGLFYLPEPQHFDYKTGNLFSSLRQINLPGNDSSTVYFLKNLPDYLAAGTMQGVYLLDKKYRGGRPRIFTLKFGEDIPGSSAEQNAVLYTPPSGDRSACLWVGTQEGAVRIDLEKLQFDTSATTLQLAWLRAADEEVSLLGKQPWRLPMKKRSVKFGFTPSGNPFLKDDLFYDITVVRHNGDTLFQHLNTREKAVDIAYLPHGDYTLHIAAYKHNVLSGQATWQLNVPKLPVERPALWFLIAALLFGGPFILFYQKKRHQVELEKSKRERDGLKIQALSNFFNPHFINNALHWVQGKYRKDPETATLIGRLADNVHLLYKNTQSGKASHALEQELHVVTNYLRIQQVRFGGGLIAHYDFQEEPGNYSGINIPAMLLQIHTENAIEKGIRNRKGAGNFSLSVRLEAEGCCIFIEDDGRGRPLVPEERIVARKGSTEVMNDLVNLYNQYNSIPLTVTYEDRIFTGADGEQYGTRVIVFIPKNYTYEFT